MNANNINYLIGILNKNIVNDFFLMEMQMMLTFYLGGNSN